MRKFVAALAFVLTLAPALAQNGLPGGPGAQIPNSAGGGSGGGSPTGAAGGGLGGTYPNPTVAAVPASAMPALTGDCTTTAGAVATSCTKTGGTAYGPAATAAAGQIPGIATSTAASAGNVGEFIGASVPFGSAVALTTNTAANVTSVSLTAGEWRCEGAVSFYNSVGNAVVTNFEGWNSATSAPTVPTPGVLGYSIASGVSETGPGTGVASVTLSTGSARYLLASTTTVYLGALAAFTVSAVGAFGTIGCQRVR